jgi:hypothetical protein
VRQLEQTFRRINICFSPLSIPEGNQLSLSPVFSFPKIYMDHNAAGTTDVVLFFVSLKE